MSSASSSSSSTLCSFSQQHFGTSTFWGRLFCLLVSPSLSIASCPPMAAAPSDPSSPMQQQQHHSIANKAREVVWYMLMTISSANTNVSNNNTNNSSISRAPPTTSAGNNNNNRRRRRPAAVTTERSRTTCWRMGAATKRNSSSSSAMVMLFALFTLSSMALPVAQSATFFYGATEESDNDGVINDQNGQFDGARALAMVETAAVQAAADDSNNNAMNEEEAKLSKQELQSVYTFCGFLPQLQQEGFLPDNEHARDICKKLVDMLKPMFRKRTRASNMAVPMPSRSRRHMATLLLQPQQQTKKR